MNGNNSFISQNRRNSVALISLAIALTSLGYDTWRNEKTEENRNQRHGAFEVLLKLNDLQQVVFHSITTRTDPTRATREPAGRTF